ncbi:aldo/keto reductase [Chelativorans xinjiangense]|uniref:aldo/keto reductase n=1 Tax=Chelativorans xinjiangense TaxID=2681485 RepID=UPI00135B916C|nr:aldo/keto reductase [Chelativorans xinjiangense]
MRSELRRIKIHENGPEFSRVVWGSMRSEQQFASSDALAEHLRFLLDRGITTLDTAPPYGHPDPYTVEEFLGRAIAKVGRNKFEIVTKCGIQRLSPHRTENWIRHFDSTEKEILRSVDRSLQKLGVDAIDVLLVHRPDYLMDPDETAGALDKVVSEGKARYIGVSNFSPSRLNLLASRLKAPIVTNQVQFSPLHLEPISDGTFDLALQLGHVPMIWSPVAGGRLLTSDDEAIRGMRSVLSEIAKKYSLAGPAEAAIAFVARHPAGRLPVIGSANRERIDGAVKAAETQLDRQDWYSVITQVDSTLNL